VQARSHGQPPGPMCTATLLTRRRAARIEPFCWRQEPQMMRRRCVLSACLCGIQIDQDCVRPNRSSLSGGVCGERLVVLLAANESAGVDALKTASKTDAEERNERNHARRHQRIVPRTRPGRCVMPINHSPSGQERAVRTRQRTSLEAGQQFSRLKTNTPDHRAAPRATADISMEWPTRTQPVILYTGRALIFPLGADFGQRIAG